VVDVLVGILISREITMRSAFWILLVGLVLPSRAAAQNCTGNACSAITIESDGGCIVVRNSGSRPVMVKPNATLVSYGTVYANSEFRPKVNLNANECATSYNFDYEARYEGDVTGTTASGAKCDKVRSSRELGYISGHETNFCIKKGYKRLFHNKKSQGFCFTGNKEACMAAVG
jgi:hypothetical protein